MGNVPLFKDKKGRESKIGDYTTKGQQGGGGCGVFRLKSGTNAVWCVTNKEIVNSNLTGANRPKRG